MAPLNFSFPSTITALFLLSLLGACDSNDPPRDAGTRDGAAVDASPSDDAIDAPVATTPTVRASSPVSGADDVPLNGNATVTFSEPMDGASVRAAFTLVTGEPPVEVPGTVIASGVTAVFWPAVQFEAETTYTATVGVEAASALGVTLEAEHVWSFTTGNTRDPGLRVNLGTAGDFVILAKSAVSTVPTSAITGDVALSPAAASFITGFSLSADPTNVFATSPQITGRVYAADYAVPTPSNLTTAVGDMELAFTDAASRAPDQTELGAGNIGGLTIARGVYKWGTGLLIPTDVTLTGTATDVWIFQVSGDLTMESGTRITLTGGALPENVFWQVAGLVDLGTTAHLEGIVLSQTSITLRTGASVNGRLLAQTAVSVDGSTVVRPAD
jgi:hypothetical protein